MSDHIVELTKDDGPDNWQVFKFAGALLVAVPKNTAREEGVDPCILCAFGRGRDVNGVVCAYAPRCQERESVYYEEVSRADYR